VALSLQVCQVSHVDYAPIERHYLYAAWISHGESIRAAPVRPRAFTMTCAKHRELYRAMVDVTRDGSWARDGVDALTALCTARGLTGALVDLVIDIGEVDPAAPLDVHACAEQLEAGYARRMLEDRLLAELAAVRQGAFDAEAAE
jgi:hypothetical protein